MTAFSDPGTVSQLPPLGLSTNRSDLVVESVKTAILSGQLAPDEVLVERRIADQLGISKTPVREALIILMRSGLLTATARRGVCVRRLSLRDVRHIYEERVLLEPWAIAHARSPHPDFKAAARALDDVERHRVDGDTAASALANRRFHRAMYAQCDNEFIVESLDRLQDLTALAAASVLWEKWPTSDKEFTEHQTIYDAAQAGRLEEAGELMREHIQASITRLADQESAEAAELSASEPAL
ncbi:GntR family transcriptional regulator [Kocuria dechangensis]|uniref:GntR family transcriptional regulator n=1 Tax=Kocuria dechangensis TaxID=1176249 RepID=A0A917H1S0_9MICC|nr:GntR family transcriptional regulator [Kocuria dechangensis]GGG64793.1 GntR family transcriptional regulator [Kocuria dechangensis]